MSESLTLKYQDWGKWGREGSIDWVVGMSFGWSETSTAADLQSLLAGVEGRAPAIIGLYSAFNNLPPDIQIRQIQTARAGGAAGESTFDYAHLTDWMIEAWGAGVYRLPAQPSPVAEAGPDQTVNEGDLVTLDGSGSSHLKGTSLTYHWKQIAPTAQYQVSLESDPVHPTFVVPNVPAGGATLTFQLTVSDGQLTSDDVVNITIKNVNHPPVADAGDEQRVQEGSPVTLDGSSYDFDAESLRYSWVQTAGPEATLSDPAAVKPSFLVPLVGPAGATLTFELIVTDGIDSTTDTVNVVVENVNHRPIADAGSDQTKNEGSPVTPSGTASKDPDGDTVTYRWSQLSGPAVTLSDPSSTTPTFTAPLVAPGGETLVFQLVVNDGLADSEPGEVAITVLNINDPPACDLARASLASLWPPDHKLVPVEIVGVADPDKDQVVFTVTGVTQDEPVNGLGDGDTSPDAVIQEGKALLRAERAGGGNGRVYQVTFTADDGFNPPCTGVVAVCVPHDRRAASCAEDGQFYDSTQP